MVSASTPDFDAHPLRLWLGPLAWKALEPSLRRELDPRAELIAVPCADQPLQGPALLVLVEGDIKGPDRDPLLELSRRALPGRPLICSISRHRDTVLEAINTWHAFRLLPRDAPFQALVVAIGKAHEVLSMELTAERTAGELRFECRRLSATIEELQVTRQRLLQAERLATVGNVTGGLMVRLQEQFRSLESFERSLRTIADDEDLTNVLETTIEGIRSIGILLQEMLALTENRDEELSAHVEQLDRVVRRAVAFLQHDPKMSTRKLQLDLDSGATVRIDRYRMYLVLMNFLRNAIQATEQGDLIAVRTALEGDTALIEVRDTGCGMTPEVRERIFTPFFTTKGERGTGLGLRVSLSAIERQGGTLEVDSAPGEGTTFRVQIPLSS
jgi:signal transduction histidine kinase